MHPIQIARHLTRLAARRLRPTPAESAWRRILRHADREGRRAGSLRLLDLVIEFPDATSLAHQWHEIFVRERLRMTLASPAPRIIDGGANVGLASLWLKRTYPEARITAFEADPALAARLRRNLDRNGAGDVEVVGAALWRHAGHVAFRAEGSDAGSIDAVAADTSGAPRDVPSVRLRDWLTAGDVDLLKLDIEGAELDVLEDSEDALDRVRAIEMEVHDFDPARRLLPGCLDLLSRAGFVYALDDFGVARWRPGAVAAGPFAGTVPMWVVLVRAWREDR